MPTDAGVRDRIIRTGAELIHSQGYTATGLQQILAKAGVPKGSFYFYFKSKEDYGIDIIQHYEQLIGSIFEKFLTDMSVAPLKRIDNLFGFYVSYFRKTRFRLGCPIGNLTLELSDTGERFHRKLNETIALLAGHLKTCLDDARRDGAIAESIDTKSAAQFIFHGFEGAILHMKASKSAEPLLVFHRCIFDYLQAPRRRNHT